VANEFLETNRRHWDGLIPHHLDSEYYDLARFKAGGSTLHALEVEELGDVAGKSLLHLQCHFGLDTLSWARRGATVTGLDFTQPAIDAARRIAAECDIDARFLVANVYDARDVLDGQFDIVFCSYGVLFWLPHVRRWAGVVASLLKPGGTFYVVDFHPMSGVFVEEDGDLVVRYPYFTPDAPLRFDEDGSYAAPDAKLAERVTYSWPHPVGEVVTALIDAGLEIRFLHEFSHSIEPPTPSSVKQPDGAYHLGRHHGCVPLLYSIKATRLDPKEP